MGILRRDVFKGALAILAGTRLKPDKSLDRVRMKSRLTCVQVPNDSYRKMFGNDMRHLSRIEYTCLDTLNPDMNPIHPDKCPIKVGETIRIGSISEGEFPGFWKIEKIERID
jgi:hypothetical protein